MTGAADGTGRTGPSQFEQIAPEAPDALTV
jgi:hypothetical protein